MSTHVVANLNETLPPNFEPQWFAIQTRSRHEKKVADELTGRGVEVFLPLITRTRKWSDRVKKVEFPLFSGYAFVHIAPEPKTRLQVLSSHGVVRFIGPTAIGTPIPSCEIENLRTALVNDIALRPLPFMKIGQRVRIRSGALTGMEGILTGTRGNHQLVVSISTIARSVSLAIEGYEIEPI
ncbi:MAG: UpxY family transcription antiterminator [Terriglobales bacterium]